MDAQTRLAERAAELWEALEGKDPQKLANSTDAKYQSNGDGTGDFVLLFWESDVRVSHPGFKTYWLPDNRPMDPFSDALLAYYFYTSDGTPLTEKWISFTELPDGRFYTQAFQGYSGNELVRHFLGNLEAFEAAAMQSGGIAYSLGDKAFIFRVFPRVQLLAVAWDGDEDFPPSYRILFDAASPRHLTTDCLAILGGNLSRRLIKNASTIEK